MLILRLLFKFRIPILFCKQACLFLKARSNKSTAPASYSTVSIYQRGLTMHISRYAKLIRLLTSCARSTLWDIPKVWMHFSKLHSEPTTTWSGTSVALSKHILSRTDTSRQCQQRDPINLSDGTLLVNEWRYKARKLRIPSVHTWEWGILPAEWVRGGVNQLGSIIEF